MLTRRQFLAGAAATVAAAAGCRSLLPHPGETAPPAGQPLRIALLSDTHAQSPTSPLAVPVNGKLIRALADFRQFGPDLWVCNGDVADHGYVGEHTAFREIMAKVARRDRLLINTGNHEFYDKAATDEESLRRFREAYGKPQAYSSHLIGSVLIIMLATEQWKTAPRNPDWAWLSDRQLRWFARALHDHRDKLTIVFLHQPLPGTVLGTGGGGSAAQADELRELLKQNPQVRLWFSGHTHYPLAQSGQIVTQGRTAFVALGSTFYLTTPSGTDAGASQSRFMEIYPDRVLVRARDHRRQAWLPDYELLIERDG